MGLLLTFPAKSIKLHVITDENWAFDRVEAKRKDLEAASRNIKPIDPVQDVKSEKEENDLKIEERIVTKEEVL